MTIVPKKKSDPKSAPTNKSSGTNVTAAVFETRQQQSGDLGEGQDLERHPDQDHHRPPPSTVQCSTSAVVDIDTAAGESVNVYSNYNNGGGGGGGGDEHTYDKRHYHHQQQHQCHNNKFVGSKNDNESSVNHVILITVVNPHYPITCDLIHQICSSHGKVNRIVIFKKNGVQAMVEFDNIEAARRARAMLHGCDIYSGCCTLKIEFAKPARLNVHRNDSDSFDYTNPNLATRPINQAQTGTGDSNDNHHQHDHQHQAQHHQHHLQASSGAHHHGGTYLQQGSGNTHHPRGTGMNRRSGGGVIGGGEAMGPHSHGNTSGHDQPFQPPAHMHPSNQHLKQSLPPALGVQHTGLQPASFTLGQTFGQSSTDPESVDTFHQQNGGFNVSRGNAVPTTNVTSHQPNFVSVDSFIPAPTSTATPVDPHGVHGNPYTRQDGHHNQSHHQPHYQSHLLHSRGVMAASGPGRGHGHHNPSFPQINSTNHLMTGAPHLSSQGTVMMVYGLSVEQINCDRLFNLFCLYGNVVRVKFLRSKEGCAMVQMGDVIAVERCVSSLNKITLFGNDLQVSYSKQAFLHDVIQPFTLPDGSPSFKDFMGNKNNRFRNPEVASKNRILPPSRVLHFFNAPFGISDDELKLLFKQTAGNEPVSLKIFTPKVDNAKSFSGLVTFRDPAEATEALVLCNHLSLPKAGAPHPYVLRLCFSPPTYC